MIGLRVTFMRRAVACLLASTALLWAALVDMRGGQSAAAGTIRALSSILPVRPTVYTFAEQTSHEEDPQFKLWKASWQAAGFHAKRLTIVDAIGHADFERFSKAIDDVLPYGHSSRRMKYFRYLAMNTVGGGILADVDVFPLWPYSHMNLPNDAIHGRFVVRCGSFKQALGCLMSGSADEWDRIAHELLSYVQRQHRKLYLPNSPILLDSPLSMWSDDDALQEIASFGNPAGRPLAKRESQVLSLMQVRDMISSMDHIPISNCHESNDRLAVKLDESVDFRLQWMQQWNKDCVNKVTRVDMSLRMES
jgi:hypothetical protein